MRKLVQVSKGLIHNHTKAPEIKQMFDLLQSDLEIQSYLQMSNVMAVERFLYNDHGPLHAEIVSGSALEIFRLITDRVEPSVIEDWGAEYVDAQIVVLCGSYLHDIGNSIHRINHEYSSCFLANPILERLLTEIYPDDPVKVYRLRSETLHCIYSHHEDIPCLSIEAGITKVADGTDMAQGRTRIPYMHGKTDIHSLSAGAIEKVLIQRGDERPVLIKVEMNNPAGVYQIEEVLGKKLETSGIDDLIEIDILIGGKEIKVL
jgi:metal-dependent HD superfamily phosphatase/phosphodiesterase